MQNTCIEHDRVRVHETARRTDFTPETFKLAVFEASRHVNSLTTPQIRAWVQTHPSYVSKRNVAMRVRVIASGLHLLRKWKEQEGDAPGFIVWSAWHVWGHRHRRVADPASYAELRRFLPRPARGHNIIQIAA